MKKTIFIISLILMMASSAAGHNIIQPEQQNCDCKEDSLRHRDRPLTKNKYRDTAPGIIKANQKDSTLLHAGLKKKPSFKEDRKIIKEKKKLSDSNSKKKTDSRIISK